MFAPSCFSHALYTAVSVFDSRLPFFLVSPCSLINRSLLAARATLHCSQFPSFTATHIHPCLHFTSQKSHLKSGLFETKLVCSTQWIVQLGITAHSFWQSVLKDTRGVALTSRFGSNLCMIAESFKLSHLCTPGQSLKWTCLSVCQFQKVTKIVWHSPDTLFEAYWCL